MNLFKILSISGLQFALCFLPPSSSLASPAQISTGALLLNFNQMTLLSADQKQSYINELTSAAKKETSTMESVFVSWSSKSRQRLCFEGIFGPDVFIGDPDSPGLSSCIKYKKNPETFFQNSNNSARWNRFMIKLSLACSSANCSQIRAATETREDSQWLVK